MASNLSAPYLHCEAAAHEFVESVIWPSGAFCVHCGGVDRVTKVKANPEKRIRVGLWRCGDCKKQFTVKVGTIFEYSKVKMHLWVQAIVLMTASKKGISSNQLHHTLGVTYKTAWFMEHRIREAMRSGDLAPFGAGGGIVEVDEFIQSKGASVEYSRTDGDESTRTLRASVPRAGRRTGRREAERRVAQSGAGQVGGRTPC